MQGPPPFSGLDVSFRAKKSGRQLRNASHIRGKCCRYSDDPTRERPVAPGQFRSSHLAENFKNLAGLNWHSLIKPIGLMYGIFTFISLNILIFMVHVGKYGKSREPLLLSDRQNSGTNSQIWGYLLLPQRLREKGVC